MKHSFNKASGCFTTCLVSIILIVGLSLAVSAPASAATAHCRDGRCTVYLSKAETKALSQGRAPALTVAGQGRVFRSGTRTSVDCRPVRQSRLVLGVWVSVYPREAQGYDGSRC